MLIRFSYVVYKLFEMCMWWMDVNFSAADSDNEPDDPVLPRKIIIFY